MVTPAWWPSVCLLGIFSKLLVPEMTCTYIHHMVLHTHTCIQHGSLYRGTCKQHAALHTTCRTAHPHLHNCTTVCLHLHTTCSTTLHVYTTYLHLHTTYSTTLSHLHINIQFCIGAYSLNMLQLVILNFMSIVLTAPMYLYLSQYTLKIVSPKSK